MNRQSLRVFRFHAIAGAVLIAVYFVIRRTTDSSLVPSGMILADGAVISGILMLIASLLRRLDRTGEFDVPAYIINRIGRKHDREAEDLVHAKSDREKSEDSEEKAPAFGSDYYEFRQSRERSSSPLLPAVIAALIYLAIGIVFSCFYI